MLSDDKKNLVLIGMPGVGKSTIGVLLAKHLVIPFWIPIFLFKPPKVKPFSNLFKNTESPVFASLNKITSFQFH